MELSPQLLAMIGKAVLDVSEESDVRSARDDLHALGVTCKYIRQSTFPVMCETIMAKSFPEHIIRSRFGLAR